MNGNNIEPMDGGKARLKFLAAVIGTLSCVASALAPAAAETFTLPSRFASFEFSFDSVETTAKRCDTGDVAACRLGFEIIDKPMKEFQTYQNSNRIADKGYRLPALNAGQKRFLKRYQEMSVRLGVVGCIRDHGYSCYRIGFSNLQGADGGKIGDLEGLQKPLEKSCKLGSADGCAALAGSLWISSDPENLKKAYDLSYRACAEKSANGCGIYGHLLKNGKGVAQDYALAADVLSFACINGHGRACGEVAEQYEKGLGVDVNFPAAEGYYNRMCHLPFGQAGCRKADGMQREYTESASLAHKAPIDRK